MTGCRLFIETLHEVAADYKNDVFKDYLGSEAQAGREVWTLSTCPGVPGD